MPSATPTSSPTPGPADDQPAAGAADADSDPDSVEWQAFVPTDTADHLATMARAARESGCGVPWQLLAAIARVESDFGRNMATSSARASGYGQFLPSSWQAFGNDGNVYDYRAALPAIATYLCQSGLAGDPRAALFAYNHADWYVDLVLDLAVRYDRMAPGAPTPDVLTLNPSDAASIPMHYAPGRDVGVQARARSLESQTRWLGIPWRGRTPGSAISASTLETTTLTMLRAAFGLTADPPGPGDDQTDPPANLARELARGLAGELASRAWTGGLFANPNALGNGWSVAEIHRRVESGQSVVALLDGHLLPGHPPGEASGIQPVIVIGVTPESLILSDPSFSSSLGYGLELSDAAFLTAWQAASGPLQALAVSSRFRPPLRETHVREPEPTPRPVAVVLASPLPRPTPVPEPEAPLSTPSTEAQTTKAAVALPPSVSPTDEIPDRSWMILVTAAVCLGGAFGFRWLRVRRWS